ncbi:hypothetical protein SAMN05216188_10694 [Lentzea xinjiangensis]|uniref:Uncharacterized protein n=2 Tax=Lentzea xinjiangensis TaxID=402600 RepID=A0A1H9JPS9_9PSEU|nr:hypothetical protein SAMN05216188_10694 [Lentzea xinjiangensis]
MPKPANSAVGNVHAVMRGMDGELYHAIGVLGARADSWSAFGDVTATSAGDPGAVRDVAAAVVNGELHVVVMTDPGGLMHTIRHAHGGWSPFRDVKTTNAGHLYGVWAVSMAAIGNELHLVVVTIDPFGLHHTIRYPDGGWSRFDNVRNAVASTPKLPTDVAVASAGRELHVLVTEPTNFGLWHAIRRADAAGTWTEFGDVQAASQNYPQREPLRVGCAVADGRLYVVALTDLSPIYTSRDPVDGSWEKARGLAAIVPVPGSFFDISATGSGERLHLAGPASDWRLWFAHRYKPISGTEPWRGFYAVQPYPGNFVGVSRVSLAVE